MKTPAIVLALAVSLPAWTGAIAAERSATFSVENMTCALCGVTVQAALEAVPGVRGVRVERGEARATVIYDDAATTVAELGAALANAGFPATAIAQ
jgi:periplasmic mercuric ion binding protein